MKKLFVSLLISIMVVSTLLIACAPKPAPPPAPAPAPAPAPKPPPPAPAPVPPPAPKPAPPPTPAQPPAVIKWKYQGHPPVADRYHEVVKRAAAKITTMSGGRLVVEPYAGGAIYPATKELYGVDAGIIEMGQACPMYYLDRFPQASLFDMMSGGLTPVQMFMWHIRGGGDELARKLWEPALNVKYIASAGHLPPEIWAHSNRELKTPADIKGLKMRCAGEGGEILARMGASTVFFPGAELYESMKRGVIDAFEYASPSLNWGMGFQEVAKYLYISPSRAPTDGSHVWVNRKAWEKIGPDLQMMVEEAVRTTGFDYYAETVVLDDTYLDKFIKYGTKVEFLPKVIEDEFLKVANAYYEEKMAKDPFYAEIVKSMRKFKEIVDKQGIR